MANTKEYNIKINGIKQSVEGVDNLGKSIGKSSNAIRETTKEMKALQSEMVGLEKGSKAWTELAKKAGDLKDRVDDIREATRRYASDTKVLDDVINLAQSATAAFTLYKGAMSAFGMETEEAEKAMQKLMAAMSIIQSLQTLQNTLKGSTATATLFTKSMKLLTFGIQGTTTASKLLRIALMSIPIMLIITLVATLIANWDDLVGWFQKTFPILNNLSAKMKGVGQAIKAFLIDPIGDFANVMKLVFSGKFSEAWDYAKNAMNKRLQEAKEAYGKGYQEEMTRKAVEEENKRTEYALKMLIARKGNEAKYSKEGIALQKKAFEQRRKLAKGDKDKLDQLALDEANFYRECQEKKSAAAKAAAKTATDAAKKRAAEEKRLAEEEAKKAKEAAEYKAKAEEALYRSTVEYMIQEKEKELEYYNAEVKMYSAGPIEKYKEAVEKVNKATSELVELQRQLKLYDFFNDYKSNIDASATSLNDFMIGLNGIYEQCKKVEGVVNVDLFGQFAKNIPLFSKLSQDQMKYLYHIYIDYLKDGSKQSKKVIADTKAVQEEQLKKEMDIIEKTTLKWQLENNKKSDKAIALKADLEQMWDNYLLHVKDLYKEDSKEYLEAQQKKKKALEDLHNEEQNSNPIRKRKNKYVYGEEEDKVNGTKNAGKTDFRAIFSLDTDGDGEPDMELFEKLEELSDMMFENVFDPIHEAFSTLLEAQIEEAEEALDKATEMHDKSVEKVQESNSRLAELKNEMANASGAQLEAMKQQQADEMLLLAQREAEEKRLAREKEKREKELEKKQKQQRKLDMAMQLAEAISNTAVGATKAFAQYGWPLGAVFAAIIGSMGAIQIATITKQMSKLADGGLLQGKSHSQGGIPVGNTGVEVEGGEYVVNKRSTAKYLPLLQALNEEGARHKTVANQIGKMADGGQLNYEKISSNMGTVDTNRIIQESIGQIDMHPVVSVVDINRGQKNLTQVRQMAGASR